MLVPVRASPVDGLEALEKEFYESSVGRQVSLAQREICAATRRAPLSQDSTYSFCCHPKLSLPFLPAGAGRARGRRACGECAGCLWARERYAMSALRLFHNIEG